MYPFIRELKRSGFPLRTQRIVEPLGEEVYEPTLSELILACGNDFHCLRKTPDPTGVVLSGLHEADGFAVIKSELCSTPEEPVARLWLALNSDKTN